jgi:hypothetical protein
VNAAPRMVKLADLWQRKSAKGTVYFSGFLGDCQVLLFKEGKKAHPTKPDEEVIVWKLLVQERDPERRSQQQRERPPAHQAERGRATGEAINERADAWSKRQGDEYVQELARRFDELEPDEVPF